MTEQPAAMSALRGHCCVTTEGACTCLAHGQALNEVDRLQAALTAERERADALSVAAAEIVQEDILSVTDDATFCPWCGGTVIRSPDGHSTGYEHEAQCPWEVLRALVGRQEGGA